MKELENSPNTSTWTRLDSVAIALVTLIGGILRFWRLAIPRTPVFDEYIFAAEACHYVDAGGPLCFDRELLAEHPPLGKWLIGWGMEVFGNNPLGWRIAAAVAGTATVAIVYLLARRVLGSTLGAAVSAGLLAIDFLHFVHSRVGMIEIFAPLFGAAAFLCLAYDRDRIAGSFERSGRGSWARFGMRPWRVAAGALAGASIASKWTGIFFLTGAILLSIAWEMGARKPGRLREVFDRALREEGVALVLSFFVMPLLVYSLTYIGRLEGTLLAGPWSEESWLRQLWETQFAAFDFHRYLPTGSVYQSRPWSWLLIMRPIQFRFTANDGMIADIVAGGSPLTWWASVGALLYAGAAWVKSREQRGPLGLILAGFLVTYPPWLVIAVGRQRLFLYYMLAAVPFMCLALGYVATRIERSRTGKAAIAVSAALAIGLFAFCYPILAHVEIPEHEWEARMWIYDDCALRPHEQLKESLHKALAREGEQGVAPTREAAQGWCGM